MSAGLWQCPRMPISPPLAAIVLAAGKGTRMRSDLHKVLHPVGGRPMLLHLMATLDALGVVRTLVVVGDKAEQVEAALEGSGAQTVVQAPQLGTGHAVLQAEAALRDFAGVCLVLFGDVPLISAHTLARLVEALDAPGEPAIAVLGFRPHAPGSYGRILADADGRISRMVEAKDASAHELAVTLCNSGLLAVRRELLFPLLHRVSNANAAQEYYLPDIVMLAAQDGLASVVIETEEREVMGVNSRAELAQAEAAFQAARRAEMMAAGVTLVAPETVFFAADTVLGRDTLVEPHVVFGAGVVAGERIAIRAHSHLEGATIGDDCEIGPFARLRPGTVLGAGAKIGNFVETKKALVGAGAKINHLSYVGDADVGAKANIGAGTITCNYDGFFKYRTVIGDAAFIGSNSSLVAPVSIGAGAIVAAGSVVTRDVLPDALAIARGEQSQKPGWAARFRAAMLAKKGKA